MASKNNALDSAWQNADAMAQGRAVAEKLTTPPALLMIQMSGITEAKGALKVFDNGCGDGIVSQTIWSSLKDHSKADLELVLGDLSPAMIKFAQERIDKAGWPSAKAVVVDMQDMKGLADSTFTHVFSNFAIQFPPKPDLVLEEMKRVCQSNAVFAATTWKSVGWTSHVRKALARLSNCPAFPDDETMFNKIQHGHAWHTEQFIEAKLKSSGFVDVQIQESVDEHKFPTKLFAATFGGMMAKSMIGLVWPADAVKEFGGQMQEAISRYFEEQKLEEVTFQNVALVVVARTPVK